MTRKKAKAPTEATVEAFRIETTHRNEGFAMDFTTVCQSIAINSLAVVDGMITTTTVDVANLFGKLHLHVMERVRSLQPELPLEFQSNFRLVDYEDAKGERRPAYRLTRDGFTLLAMGFTGKKALQFKLAYIEAFNRMEAQLRGAAPVANPTLTVNDMVARLTRQVEHLPSGIFMPLVNAVLRKHGLAIAAPAQSSRLPVDRMKLNAIWVDLGKLRERIDGLAIMDSDLPPEWWQRNAISGH